MPVYPLLALLWAIVLVPPIVRGRIRHRAELAEFDRVRLCFVGASDAVVHGLGRSSPPAVRRTAAQRRRRVLAVIGMGMVATLIFALIAGTRLAWGLHLLVYDVLIGYVALLARSRGKRPVRALHVPPEWELEFAEDAEYEVEPEPVRQLVLLEAASR